MALSGANFQIKPGAARQIGLSIEGFERKEEVSWETDGFNVYGKDHRQENGQAA